MDVMLNWSPWCAVAVAVLSQVPRVLRAVVHALMCLVAAFSRDPARRRSAHRLARPGE